MTSGEMALLLLLTASVRAALLQGPVPFQLLRAGPPSIQYNADCVVDQLYEGPSCDTFFMCMGGRTFNHQLVLFSCGQGTMFDSKRSVCVLAQPSRYPNGPDRITGEIENSFTDRPPTTSQVTSSISLLYTSRPSPSIPSPSTPSPGVPSPTASNSISSPSTSSPTASNSSPSPITSSPTVSNVSPSSSTPSPSNASITQSPPSPTTKPSTLSPPSPSTTQILPSPPSPTAAKSTPSPTSPTTTQSTPSQPSPTTRPITSSPPSPTNRPSSPSPPSPTTRPSPPSPPSPPGPPPFVLGSRPPSPPGFQPPKLSPPKGPFPLSKPNKPSKPSRPLTSLIAKRPRPGGFLGSIIKPLISITPFGLDNPEPQGSPTCPQYSLDPTSLVNCTREGRWEHPGDCNRFFQCIHTMDCILKGFIFRCPDDFHFVKSSGKCEALLRPTPCHKFSDASDGSFTYPVIQLEEESIKQFQQASAYWDYMSFISGQS